MIVDVVNDIRTDLAARLVPAEVLSGKEHVSRDGPGNRVVFVESNDTFEPVGRPGGNPRPVLVRAAGAQVHIWGVAAGGPDATPDQHRATTNALLHQVLFSLHKSAGASRLGYEAQSGAWNNDAEIQFGAEYVLTIAVKVPVCDVPWQTVSGVTAAIVDRIKLGNNLVVACGE